MAPGVIIGMRLQAGCIPLNSGFSPFRHAIDTNVSRAIKDGIASAAPFSHGPHSEVFCKRYRSKMMSVCDCMLLGWRDQHRLAYISQDGD